MVLSLRLEFGVYKLLAFLLHIGTVSWLNRSESGTFLMLVDIGKATPVEFLVAYVDCFLFDAHPYEACRDDGRFTFSNLSDCALPCQAGVMVVDPMLVYSTRREF